MKQINNNKTEYKLNFLYLTKQTGLLIFCSTLNFRTFYINKSLVYSSEESNKILNFHPKLCLAIFRENIVKIYTFL